MVYLALVGGAHIHVPNFIKRVQARDDVAVSHVWDHDPDRAQRRAAALGADFQIKSAAGAGTVVLIKIPMK